MTSYPAHNNFFQQSMQDRLIAQDFFRAHLPKRLLNQLDLDKLARMPDNFVDTSLVARASDLIYRVPSCQTGNDNYLIAFVEHQSRGEKFMPLRMLGYKMRIWEAHHKQHPDQLLPQVYGLILYHGRTSPYPHSTDIWSLTDDPESCKKDFVDPAPLVDLTIMSDEEIQSHGHAALMEMSQKHIFAKDMLPILRDSLLALMREVLDQEDGDYIRSVLHYLADKANISDRQEAADLLLTLETDYTGDIMTTLAEHWREEGVSKGIAQGMMQGREEGIQVGIEKGISKGRQEGMLKIAKSMLTANEPVDKIMQFTDLSRHAIETLQAELINDN